MNNNPLNSLTINWSFSWLDQLTREKEESDRFNNNTKRRVKNGHYVFVNPKGLKDPRLVAYSKDVSDMLHLKEEDVKSDEFKYFFSGNIEEALNGWNTKTWATPYALSIMGTRYLFNCPFGTGEGYGDGRAISIGEAYFEDSKIRLEMQLKGGGPTPFCRGADGRAVLRSSIREFLASEAMHYLGVSTTRALSIIVSDVEKTYRPWYSDQSRKEINVFDDGRKFGQKRDPDMMIEEQCAITCRVSPSFLRIGHIDLFARRVSEGDTSSSEFKELLEIVWHAAFREFKEEAYDPFYDKNDYKSMAKKVLEKSAEQIAILVCNWIRVGFSQGNFNGDNCLVAGRTMDYGPFGFMDQYDPFFAKWIGSDEHFGFLNQPFAGLANYVTLVESVMPLLSEDPNAAEFRQNLLERAQLIFQTKLNQVFNLKLGFHPTLDEPLLGQKLWQELEPLLRESKADWTLFWRHLYHINREFELDDDNYDQMLQLLEGNESAYPGTSPFYEPLTSANKQLFVKWIEKYRQSLQQCQDKSNITQRMRLSNPKYVLRESMLADAYNSASKGDETKIHQLLQLIKNPYDEGSQYQQNNFFKRAPDSALVTGGTAFMS